MQARSGSNRETKDGRSQKYVDDRLMRVLTARESAMKSNLSRQVQGQSLQFIEQHVVRLLNGISQCGEYKNIDFRPTLASITEFNVPIGKNSFFSGKKAATLCQTHKSYYEKMEKKYDERLKSYGFRPKLCEGTQRILTETRGSAPETQECPRTVQLYNNAVEARRQEQEQMKKQEEIARETANRGKKMTSKEADKLFEERYQNIVKRRAQFLESLERIRKQQQDELRDMSIPKTNTKTTETSRTYLEKQSVLQDLVRDYDELIQNSITSASARRINTEKTALQKKIAVLNTRKTVNPNSFSQKDLEELNSLTESLKNFSKREEQIKAEIRKTYEENAVNKEQILKENTISRLSMVGNHKEEIEKTKERVLEEEMRECSFKPTILPSKVKIEDALDENGKVLTVSERLYIAFKQHENDMEALRKGETAKFMEDNCPFKPERSPTELLPKYLIAYRINEERSKKRSEELEKKRQKQREERLRQKNLRDFIKNDYETYYKNVSLFPDVDPLSVNRLTMNDTDGIPGKEISKTKSSSEKKVQEEGSASKATIPQRDSSISLSSDAAFSDEDDDKAFDYLLTGKKDPALNSYGSLSNNILASPSLNKQHHKKQSSKDSKISNDEEAINDEELDGEEKFERTLKKFQELKSLPEAEQKKEEKKLREEATKKILGRYYVDQETGKRVSAYEKLYKNGILRHKFLETLKENFDPQYSHKPQICRAPNTEILEKVELRFYRNEQKQALHDKKQSLAFTKNRLVEKRDSRASVITKLSESQFANSEMNATSNDGALSSTVSKKEKAALTTASICKRLHEKGQEFINNKRLAEERANAMAIEMSKHHPITAKSAEIAEKRRSNVLDSYFMLFALYASKEDINEYSGETELVIMPGLIELDKLNITKEAMADFLPVFCNLGDTTLNKAEFRAIMMAHFKANIYRREWIWREPKFTKEQLEKLKGALSAYNDINTDGEMNEDDNQIDSNKINTDEYGMPEYNNDIFLNTEDFHDAVVYDGTGYVYYDNTSPNADHLKQHTNDKNISNDEETETGITDGEHEESSIPQEENQENQVCNISDRKEAQKNDELYDEIMGNPQNNYAVVDDEDEKYNNYDQNYQKVTEENVENISNLYENERDCADFNSDSGLENGEESYNSPNQSSEPVAVTADADQYEVQNMIINENIKNRVNENINQDIEDEECEIISVNDAMQRGEVALKEEEKKRIEVAKEIIEETDESDYNNDKYYDESSTGS